MAFVILMNEFVSSDPHVSCCVFICGYGNWNGCDGNKRSSPVLPDTHFQMLVLSGGVGDILMVQVPWCYCVFSFHQPFISPFPLQWTHFPTSDKFENLLGYREFFFPQNFLCVRVSIEKHFKAHVVLCLSSSVHSCMVFGKFTVRYVVKEMVWARFRCYEGVSETDEVLHSLLSPAKEIQHQISRILSVWG